MWSLHEIHISLPINKVGNIVTLVYGCSPATPAEWSSYNKDHTARKAENIYRLVFYRKSCPPMTLMVHSYNMRAWTVGSWAVASASSPIKKVMIFAHFFKDLSHEKTEHTCEF